jgi:hypothetical protein
MKTPKPTKDEIKPEQDEEEDNDADYTGLEEDEAEADVPQEPITIMPLPPANPEPVNKPKKIPTREPSEKQYPKGKITTPEAEYGDKEIVKKFKQANPKTAKKLEYNGAIQKMEYQGGSYADLYRGNTRIRTIPFVWQQDTETRNSWAVFSFNDFYNQKPSIWPWRRLKYQIVIIPVDKGMDACDLITGGHTMAKFDIDSLSQMNIHINYNKELLEKLAKQQRLVSANLQLYRDLNKYTNPKTNWYFIIGILIVAAFAILGYWYITSHPQFLQGIQVSLQQYGL